MCSLFTMLKRQVEEVMKPAANVTADGEGIRNLGLGPADRRFEAHVRAALDDERIN